MNFYAIQIQHFTTDSNSKKKLVGLQKFTNGYEGICMSGGKLYNIIIYAN